MGTAQNKSPAIQTDSRALVMVRSKWKNQKQKVGSDSICHAQSYE